MNSLKTALLLAALTGLLLAAGAMAGGGWLVLSLLLALGLNLGAYFWSDRLVLRLQGARPLAPGEAPELEQEVADLARRAGLPMPRVYLIPDDAMNAFATGRTPEKGVVAFTEGLLRCLPRRELRGVIAHELAHIQHRDILLATVAAGLAGALGLLAHALQFGALFGGSSDEDAPHPMAGLLFVLVAPIMASLLQFAISRSREYHADARAAQLTGDPEGLALALHRLGASQGLFPPGPTAQPATASLMIASPFAGGLGRWFSTHPPLSARIARLRAMQTSHPSAA